MTSVLAAVPGVLADTAPLPPARPTLPVAPEPLTDGGTDRLVGVPRPVVAARPSAVLLAAQQLSEEAARHRYRTRALGPSGTDRGGRRRRALVAQRRADRYAGG